MLSKDDEASERTRPDNQGHVRAYAGAVSCC